MSLFITTMRFLDYNAMVRLKSWNSKAGMWRERLLRKFARPLSPTENVSSTRDVLGKNAFKEHSVKKKHAE